MKRSTTLFAKTSQQAKEVQRSSNKWNLCQGWTEDGCNLHNSNMCSHVRISLTTMRGSSSFHRTRHVNLLREDWSLTFGSWWRSFAGCSLLATALDLHSVAKRCTGGMAPKCRYLWAEQCKQQCTKLQCVRPVALHCYSAIVHHHICKVTLSWCKPSFSDNCCYISFHPFVCCFIRGATIRNRKVVIQYLGL